MKPSPKADSVDAYIRRCPSDVAKRLHAIRTIIKKSAPEAEELIRYGMPAYKLNGPMVYFAAFTHHIGFYALPQTQAVFKKELTRYKTSKGTVQFQHNEPLPLPLIKKMVTFRAKEQRAKSKNS